MGASLSSSSIGTPSSSLSSSLPLLTPWGSLAFAAAPSATASKGLDTGATEGAPTATDEGGALKIDCCNSVPVT